MTTFNSQKLFRGNRNEKSAVSFFHISLMATNIRSYCYEYDFHVLIGENRFQLVLFMNVPFYTAPTVTNEKDVIVGVRVAGGGTGGRSPSIVKKI